MAIHSERYTYASLFGKIVTEWLTNPNDANRILDDAARMEIDTEAVTTPPTDFEPVGRQEMHEQRMTWESLVFKECKVDQDALVSHLSSLFDSTQKSKKATKTPFETLRIEVGKFKVGLLDRDSLHECIQGCIRSDLFAGKKRQALLDLHDKQTVLDEMVDVLNMDLNSLETWTWGTTPIPVTQRRQVNGKYRFYMDEEIHQALLLQYVGSRFAVHLKACFTGFYQNPTWSGAGTSSMTMTDMKRRTFFLQSGRPHSGSAHSVNRFGGYDTVKTLRRSQYY